MSLHEAFLLRRCESRAGSRTLGVGTVAGAIDQAHRTVGIAKQWEIEVKLLREGGVFQPRDRS